MVRIVVSFVCLLWCINKRGVVESIINPSRIIRVSVDYGPRIIGLAKSDMFGHITPWVAIRNTGNLSVVANEIISMSRGIGASEIVVGIPVDSNGRLDYGVQNFNGRLCLQFSQVLCALVDHTYPRAKVILADERYTTREAKARMKIDRIQASLDAMSAACLLERYIEDEGEGSISAKACPFPVPEEFARFDYDDVRTYVRLTHQAVISKEQSEQHMMRHLKAGGRLSRYHKQRQRSTEETEEKDWQ